MHLKKYDRITNYSNGNNYTNVDLSLIHVFFFIIYV